MAAAIVFGLVAIAAMGALFYADVQRNEALAQSERAERNALEAREQTRIANEQQEIAETQAGLAREQSAKAEELSKEAEKQQANEEDNASRYAAAIADGLLAQ